MTFNQILMKINLSREQLEKLKDTYDNAYYPQGATARDGMRAALDLYESEIRPKDAGPVMWRRGKSDDPEAIYTNGPEIGQGWFPGCTHHLTGADLVAIPFPADPTPEEKAEAEMESAWKSTPVGNGGHKDCFRAGFMAAKFPAEGGVKP